MRTRSILTIFILLFSLTGLAQTPVTQGPVSVNDSFEWTLPSNVTTADAPTFTARVRDSLQPGIVTEITAFTCAGTICTTKLTAANVDALNRVGQHTLTVSLFRADVGDSAPSPPFSLASPAGAPTRLRLIR
jgi:hypothetical protein